MGDARTMSLAGGRRVLGILVAAAALSGASASAQDTRQQQEPASTIPAWFLEDIEYMTRDGGRWVADNRIPDEPYQQWGMEWRPSPDGTSMTGRLYGLSNGQQSADFFQFRQFWHPNERRALVMQWGGGGWFGVGEITRMGDDWSLLEQSFWTADGRGFRVGHIARTSPNERVTEQYDILPNQSAWRLNHALTWRRAEAGQ